MNIPSQSDGLTLFREDGLSSTRGVTPQVLNGNVRKFPGKATESTIEDMRVVTLEPSLYRVT